MGIAAVPSDGMVGAVLSPLMQAISVVIPRLDLFGQAGWLVYGLSDVSTLDVSDHASDFSRGVLGFLGTGGYIALQGVAFTGLLLSAAAFDFSRKRF